MKIQFIFCLLLSSLSFPCFGQDIPNATDHPALSRYPGSSIAYYYQKEYNELQIAQGMKEGIANDLLDVKGKHTSILYKGPEGRSTLEIFRNYEKAIQEAGGELLFSCSGIYAPGGCDHYKQYFDRRFFNSVYQKRTIDTDQYTFMEGGGKEQAYISAKLDRGNTITYIEIGLTGRFLNHPSSIQVEVVEVSKMEAGLITVEHIKEQLDQYGKVQIYTIFFKTDSHQIESGSAATLQAISDYLKKYPKENLYIVGHSDDTGRLEYNMDLSEKRAQAVSEAIIQQVDHSKGRLLAKGVGPLSPETTNETEDGKRANRRVELVRRL